MSSEENSSIQQGSQKPRPPQRTTESKVLHWVQQRKDFEANQQSDTAVPNNSALNNQIERASQEPLTLPIIHSNLSVAAKEFVPRSQQPVSVSKEPPGSNSQLENSSYSSAVLHDTFSYNNDQTQQSNQFGEYDISSNFGGMTLGYNQTEDRTGNPVIDSFNHAIEYLMLSPGNMEEYLKPVCEIVTNDPSGLVNTETVLAMVDALMEQGISQPNFRYTGARICHYLTRNLKENPTFSGFLQLFMKRCQKEYEKKDTLIKGNDTDKERLRGLAMFLAEIFLNVEVQGPDGSFWRINSLPPVLIKLIELFVKQDKDADIKCACQLLKLSGGIIEDIVKNNPDQCVQFEDIFSSLRQLNGKFSANTETLMRSVLQLKESSWNRYSSPPKKPMFFNNSVGDPNTFKQEPVFYNQQGKPCSRQEAGFVEDDLDDRSDNAYVLNDEEEEAFIQWQVEQELGVEAAGWASSDAGYPPLDEFDEGGMGEEVESAYEEFLQEQTYLHQNNVNDVQTPVQQASVGRAVPNSMNSIPHAIQFNANVANTGNRQFQMYPPQPAYSQDLYGYASSQQYGQPMMAPQQYDYNQHYMPQTPYQAPQDANYPLHPLPYNISQQPPPDQQNQQPGPPFHDQFHYQR